VLMIFLLHSAKFVVVTPILLDLALGTGGRRAGCESGPWSRTPKTPGTASVSSPAGGRLGGALFGQRRLAPPTMRRSGLPASPSISQPVGTSSRPRSLGTSSITGCFTSTW
jgi:hypothetical protein